MIDVDLTGVFLCMQHELRQMLAQGDGGAIVNVSSGAGVVPAPGQPQYTAAKHGVLGLTKQAAQEYARAGIRVNAVLPGQTETEPMRAYLDAQPDRGERCCAACRWAAWRSRPRSRSRSCGCAPTRRRT